MSRRSRQVAALADALADALAEFRILKTEYRYRDSDRLREVHMLRADIAALGSRLNSVTLIAEALADLSDERYLMLKQLMPPAPEDSA